MSEWKLVWKTLDYGRRSTTNASWLTLIFILTTVSLIFMLFKVQWTLAGLNTDKSGAPIRKVKTSTKLRTFLKALPGIFAVIVLILFLRWIVDANISYNRTNWQADYFVLFVFMFLALILLTIYESMLVLRRTLTWFFVNGMFKFVLVLFTGLLLAPYYVYATSQEKYLFNSVLSCASFFIFLTYVVICLYVFRASPFATLIPMVVLWGASLSYYDGLYAVKWAMMFNGSSLVVGILSALGISSIFGGIDKQMRGGASPQFMFAYCIVLFVAIAGFWFFIWAYYGLPLFGTEYTAFHSSSFYR